MRYRGFIITACPDHGIERFDSNKQQTVACNGYYCEVFPGNNDQYENRLDYFCLAEGYEIADCSYESLSSGIREYIDGTVIGLREAAKDVELCRYKELLSRALPLLESGEYESLYDMLSDKVFMSDSEIWKFCHCNEIDKTVVAKDIADFLVDTGTENSTTGNWHIEFEEVNNKFGVDLSEDSELMENIMKCLDPEIVSDVDATDDFDLNFYLNYCPNYEPSTIAELL